MPITKPRSSLRTASIIVAIIFLGIITLTGYQGIKWLTKKTTTMHNLLTELKLKFKDSQLNLEKYRFWHDPKFLTDAQVNLTQAMVTIKNLKNIPFLTFNTTEPEKNVRNSQAIIQSILTQPVTERWTKEELANVALLREELSKGFNNALKTERQGELSLNRLTRRFSLYIDSLGIISIVLLIVLFIIEERKLASRKLSQAKAKTILPTTEIISSSVMTKSKSAVLTKQHQFVKNQLLELKRRIATLLEIGNSPNGLKTILAQEAEIDEQIKILSLNIQIEASRIGEPGTVIYALAQELKQLAALHNEVKEDIAQFLKGRTPNDEVKKTESEVGNILESIDEALSSIERNQYSISIN